MRRILATGLASVLIVGWGRVVVPVHARASEVVVNVTYTGKGIVDDTHEIWVFLFDTPNIMAGGVGPLAVQVIRKSGGAASFTGVATDPVYVAVAYDEKGDFNGSSGPPPTGTPIAFHSKDGKTNAPVSPGPAAKIKLTFSDARRMP
jgi:hypothetical protein